MWSWMSNLAHNADTNDDTQTDYKTDNRLFHRTQQDTNAEGSQPTTSGSFQYFIKMDSDSFLNVRQLQYLIALLPKKEDRKVGLYLGRGGRGRPEERAKLGLNGKAYCIGMAYMMDEKAVSAMAPHWQRCKANLKTEHSDTEIGRCVIGALNTECMTMPEYFHQVYYTRVDRRLTSRAWKGLGPNGEVNKQMKLVFAAEPFQVHFQAAFIHSFKFPADIERFYHQTKYYLRPLQPPLLTEASATKNIPVSMYEKHATYRLFNFWDRQSCVHNPVVQRQKYETKRRECSPRPTNPVQTQAIVQQSTVIFSAWPRSKKSIAQLQKLETKLGELDIKPRIIDVLRYNHDSEEDMAKAMAGGAYVSGMIKPLEKLLVDPTLANETKFMFLHESDVLHCNFRWRLLELIKSSRCGTHLSREGTGALYIGTGVRMAGDMALKEAFNDAYSPHSPPLDASDAEKKAYPKSAAAKMDQMCFNVWDSSHLNCFSAIYHRVTLQRLVVKLKERLQTTNDRQAGPLDSLEPNTQHALAPAPTLAPDRERKDLEPGDPGANEGATPNRPYIISACRVASLLAEDGHITRAAVSDLTACTGNPQVTRLRPVSCTMMAKDLL